MKADDVHPHDLLGLLVEQHLLVELVVVVIVFVCWLSNVVDERWLAFLTSHKETLKCCFKGCCRNKVDASYRGGAEVHCCLIV